MIAAAVAIAGITAIPVGVAEIVATAFGTTGVAIAGTSSSSTPQTAAAVPEEAATVEPRHEAGASVPEATPTAEAPVDAVTAMGLAPGSIPWKARIEDAIERRDADLDAIRLRMQTVDRSEVIELERRLQLRKLDFEIEVLAMQVESFHEAARTGGDRVDAGGKDQASMPDAPEGRHTGAGAGEVAPGTAPVDSGAEVGFFRGGTRGHPIAVVEEALANARAFRDRLIAVEPERHRLTPSSDSTDRPTRAGEVTR